MSKYQVERIRQKLRQVLYPGFERDIVSNRFVKNIDVVGKDKEKVVTVHFSPNTTNQKKVAQMEEDIRKVLISLEDIKTVKINRSFPFEREAVLSGNGSTPPGAGPKGEALTAAQIDDTSESLMRADIAREAGYDEDGPDLFAGPELDALVLETYDGALPVYQWDIDPQNSAAESGGRTINVGEWEYRLWWQHHPAGLAYVSIQALREDSVDHQGDARIHPVGRSEAVNLVYDKDRKAVIAIYGTVRDFRPFVDAFRQGFGIEQTIPQESDANDFVQPETSATEMERK